MGHRASRVWGGGAKSGAIAATVAVNDYFFAGRTVTSRPAKTAARGYGRRLCAYVSSRLLSARRYEHGQHGSNASDGPTSPCCPAGAATVALPRVRREELFLEVASLAKVASGALDVGPRTRQGAGKFG